jgi:hypothetical protein
MSAAVGTRECCKAHATPHRIHSRRDGPDRRDPMRAMAGTVVMAITRRQPCFESQCQWGAFAALPGPPARGESACACAHVKIGQPAAGPVAG